MYAVEVREHIMIAHSLPTPFFGPAQNLHGATYVVDATFFRKELSDENVVVDIGRAQTTLREVLAQLNYGNLDTMPAFSGVLTTTEFLCRWIFDQLQAAIDEGRLGPGAEGVTAMRITLNESHIAKAWYEGPIVR